LGRNSITLGMIWMHCKYWNKRISWLEKESIRMGS
jgi:hypothetical protein